MSGLGSLDSTRIAKILGAEHRGRVETASGYFGALEVGETVRTNFQTSPDSGGRLLDQRLIQVIERVRTRFQAPANGGRPTDPNWTQRRLVPLSSDTLPRLQSLAKTVSEESGVTVRPLQMAALLLEEAVTALEADVASSVEKILKEE